MGGEPHVKKDRIQPRASHPPPTCCRRQDDAVATPSAFANRPLSAHKTPHVQAHPPPPASPFHHGRLHCCRCDRCPPRRAQQWPSPPRRRRASTREATRQAAVAAGETSSAARPPPARRTPSGGDTAAAAATAAVGSSAEAAAAALATATALQSRPTQGWEQGACAARDGPLCGTQMCARPP